MKGLKLSKGDYASERLGDTCYYVFEDRKRVCFVSNVFPERMDSDVVRVQLDGSLQLQAIPPMLPAYNKYMGGVDHLSQVRKCYGFDTKSRRYWVRAFFQLFYYAINNAYLLYKHNCRLHDMTPRDLLDFRSDLMKLLICPGKHRYSKNCGPSKPKLRWLCELLSVLWEKLDYAEESADTMDAGIHPPHHTSWSLQNPMFCRLPQKLKFYIILLIFVHSPLISLYSNLENYVFAHFCQLCSSFCQDEWLQLFKSVKIWMQENEFSAGLDVRASLPSSNDYS